MFVLTTILLKSSRYQLGMAYRLILTDIRYLQSADIRYRYLISVRSQPLSDIAQPISDILSFADIRYLYRLNANRYQYPLFERYIGQSDISVYRYALPSISLCAYRAFYLHRTVHISEIYSVTVQAAVKYDFK